jgi:hypothetical protein
MAVEDADRHAAHGAVSLILLVLVVVVRSGQAVKNRGERVGEAEDPLAARGLD